ncbi:ribosomal protection tetracycline resistance protein [Desulfocicer vacuolatum DSM 3385]|uniref:Ribosomal protection tetracycline resistance protein n=1 Tax=Desulfocicer vacuolatum DSM 3385 TaxID=1121400 RepID=A0A1W2DKM8_9BACT|nr:TetM/TetW/TetO/TetS family tetracycline resistance ribosomal protection protein [Desulfocicer vacuolatum]SMC98035.1 ribosomal protection tetracycline resistance protein [Desulfocicer vacuolatum DSM 3385]
MNNKILNIGIVAHVDAGKTTLTEQLLFQSGAIKKPGSVDKGSTITDNLDLEKQRGITIQNSCVSFHWKNTKINLIDTPGHIDFSAEVDRAMSVLDGVVLLLSAVDGVQAHSLNLWENIKELGIPVLIFINKIDRAGANGEQVFADLQKEFNIKAFCLNIPENGCAVQSCFHCDVDIPLMDQSYENLADLDDAVLENYLEGTLSTYPSLDETIQEMILSRAIIPVHFGIAKEGTGIPELADSICRLTSKNGVINDDATPSARIFKLEHHARFGKLAHIRVCSGTMQSKTGLYCERLKRDIKINQLLQNSTGKLEVVNTLSCNDIGIVAISEAVIAGDALGRGIKKEPHDSIAQSVLSVMVEACDDKDYQELARALHILNIEDPDLDFSWDKKEKEFFLKILGPMQIEILHHMLKERFNIEVDIKPPRVMYKETVVEKARAIVRYTMPKPCWAVMTFEVSPGKLNSGVVFESLVGVDDISQKYQNEVERAIPWALEQGIKGWPVTDIGIRLIAGEEHTVHSNPGDFLLATPMGIMNALKNAGTRLLEPFYVFDIKAPRDLLGAIINDLNTMKADVGLPRFDGHFFFLKGTVPVAEAMDYSIKFNACCSGKGRLKLKIGGYRPCETTGEKIREFKGINPLDTSQWILHNRGALKSNDRIR